MNKIRNFVMGIDLKEVLNEYNAQKPGCDGERGSIHKHYSLKKGSHILVELDICFRLGMKYTYYFSHKKDYYYLDFFMRASVGGKYIGDAREYLLSLENLTEQELLSLTNDQLWNMIVERL